MESSPFVSNFSRTQRLLVLTNPLDQAGKPHGQGVLIRPDGAMYTGPKLAFSPETRLPQ